jgi:hypothetical protein
MLFKFVFTYRFLCKKNAPDGRDGSLVHGHRGAGRPSAAGGASVVVVAVSNRGHTVQPGAKENI